VPNDCGEPVARHGHDCTKLTTLSAARASASILEPMTAAELEALLRYVALPPLKLALRERYLRLPRRDPAAAVVIAEELAAIERRLARLTRQGWWN